MPRPQLALYLAAWWLLRPLGNTGLWLAILIYFGARGVLQAMRAYESALGWNWPQERVLETLAGLQSSA